MDPDIPMPSIEYVETSNTHELAQRMNDNGNAALDSATAVPLPPSSPVKSPYRRHKTQDPSSSPHRPPSSPSRSNSQNHDRLNTPALKTRRSNSTLNVSKGVTPSKPQFRRTSSNLNPSSPGISMKTTPSPPLELRKPDKITAESIAREYFRQELDLHATADSPVLVLVHDSCYGHRFSRPRTSKAALNTIVERPERIHAAILGISTAYVRMGGRHVDGDFEPNSEKFPSKSTTIPFGIRKSTRSLPLNHPSVTHIHGTKWMEELQIMCDSAESKLLMNGKELVRPIGYGKDENGNTLPKLHEGDLYLCSETLAALQGCLGGVCDAVDAIFGPSTIERAFVCIRPPGHHCSSNYPSGFCWLNNVHVGIAYGAMNHGLTHAAIIDFDLHHGDGSQTIAWDHNRHAQGLPKNAAPQKKTPIGYYSLHDINSYPCEWGDEDKVRNASLCLENAHGQSIWNVHLEPWKSHEDFWNLYSSRYSVLLDKARNFLRYHTAKLRSSGNVKPKAAIFLSAGFDASEWEGAGMQRHNVNVPTDFYARFTSDCAKMASEPDLGVEGRIVSVLEGGYSDRALTSGVLSHLCGLVDGSGTRENQSGTDSTSNLGSISTGMVTQLEDSTSMSTSNRYQTDWWSLSKLEALEGSTSENPTQPLKMAKNKAPGNYSSPTHASDAKMTEQARERRSLSSQFESRLLLDSESPGPPSPPPTVDWLVATHELARLVIPKTRQTLSCTHDELNAEAKRSKRDRQSAMNLNAGIDERMSLRDRRPHPPAIAEIMPDTSRKSHRRTTIASVSDLPDPSLETSVDNVSDTNRPRRRSSAASSILSSFQDMKLTDDNEKDRKTPVPASNSKLVSSYNTSTQPTKSPAARKPKAIAAKAPVKPRSSPKKPSATIGTTTLSRRSSLTSEKVDAKQSSSRSGPGSRAQSRSRRQSQEIIPNHDEVENITNTMKKVSIKLKMPTGTEHSTKEKKNDEEKPKKPRGPRKPVAAKPTKTKNVTTNDNDVKNEVSGADSIYKNQANAVLTQPNTSADNGSSEATLSRANSTFCQTPSLPSADIMNHIAKPENNSAVLANEASADVPSQFNSGGFRGESSSLQQEIHEPVASNPNAPIGPLESAEKFGEPSLMNREATTNFQISSRNMNNIQDVSTASRPLTPNKKSKQDLPVFTSQSPIPFAQPDRPPSSNNMEEGMQKEDFEQKPSIWNLPDTPHH